MTPNDESRQFRHNDEIASIEFREQTKSALSVLHDTIDRVEKSFSEFKIGLGKRIDDTSSTIKNHDDRLARMETSLRMLINVTWAIALASITIIVATFW